MDPDQIGSRDSNLPALSHRQTSPTAPQQLPQCTGESSTSPDDPPEQKQDSSIHPAAFDFPTLSPDGSVDTLSTSARQRRMAERDELSDTHSLADSQYDFVEDASDISNGETASVASTERVSSDEGLEEPEFLLRSIVDDDGAAVVDDQQDSSDETEASMDSFLSEDLETPRQSSLPSKLCGQDSNETARPSGPLFTWRLVFIGDRSVPEFEKELICAKVTSSLAGRNMVDTCRAVQLPATPAGVVPPSASIFQDGNVECSVQHCVQVDLKTGLTASSPAYALHLLSPGSEDTSVYTIGGTLKSDFETPDFAIIYLSGADDQRSTWFELAEKAMNKLQVPFLIIRGRDVSPLDFHGGLVPRFDVDEFMSIKAKHLCLFLRASLARRSNKSASGASRKYVNWPSHGISGSIETFGSKIVDFNRSVGFWRNLIVGIIAVAIGVFFSPMKDIAGRDVGAQHVIRRDSLELALIEMTGDGAALKSFNLDQLLPPPTLAGQTLPSKPSDPSYFQGVAPNHIVVSLSKQPNSWTYPRVKATRIMKGSHDIAFNQTQLIEGIYGITIEPSEAYGLVDLNMLTAWPSQNITMQCNFGNRMFHRETYAKAGTDLNKIMSKDLIVARKAARSFSEKLQLELTASAAATRDVTKQLVVYAARDLQLFTSSAATILKQADRAREEALAKLRADVAVYQTNMAKLGESVKALVPTKKQTLSPLKLASDRAVALNAKLAEHVSWKGLLPSRKDTAALSTVPGRGLTHHTPKDDRPCKFGKLAASKREKGGKVVGEGLRGMWTERKKGAECSAERQAHSHGKEKPKIEVSKCRRQE